MPISPSKTRILLTIDKDLLAWVDTQAEADNRDRNNWIITQILNVKKEVSPMKKTVKEYHILYGGGTELKSITPEEAKEILGSAETRHSSLSEYEKLSIEESLLESDEDAETIDCAECLAVKIDGTWYDLPKAYR